MSKNRLNASATPDYSQKSHQDVSAAFRSSYAEYQYTFVQFFIEHLSDLSRRFNGDLSEMLILAVIGQAYMNAFDARSGALRSKPRGEASINASRLSDVTGIPRQTVRRKLESLQRRGWVERKEDASWALVVQNSKSPAKEGLADIDSRAIDRVSQLYIRLRDIAER